MDYLAIVLAALAAVAGVLSTDGRPHGRFGTVGIAVALLALALICQFTGLTQHAWVNNH